MLGYDAMRALFEEMPLMPSFFMIEAQPLAKDSQTMKLHQLLNWVEIERQMVGLYRREFSNAGGPEPYAPLGMFKLMLLGQYSCSGWTQ